MFMRKRPGGGPPNTADMYIRDVQPSNSRNGATSSSRGDESTRSSRRGGSTRNSRGEPYQSSRSSSQDGRDTSHGQQNTGGFDRERGNSERGDLYRGGRGGTKSSPISSNRGSYGNSQRQDRDYNQRKTSYMGSGERASYNYSQGGSVGRYFPDVQRRDGDYNPRASFYEPRARVDILMDSQKVRGFQDDSIYRLSGSASSRDYNPFLDRPRGVVSSYMSMDRGRNRDFIDSRARGNNRYLDQERGGNHSYMDPHIGRNAPYLNPRNIDTPYRGLNAPVIDRQRESNTPYMDRQRERNTPYMDQQRGGGDKPFKDQGRSERNEELDTRGLSKEEKELALNILKKIIVKKKYEDSRPDDYKAAYRILKEQEPSSSPEQEEEKPSSLGQHKEQEPSSSPGHEEQEASSSHEQGEPSSSHGRRQEQKPSSTRGRRKEPKPSPTRGRNQEPKPSPTRGRNQEPKPSPTRGRNQEPKPASTRGRQQEPKPYSTRGRQQEPKPYSTRGRQQEPTAYSTRGRQQERARSLSYGGHQEWEPSNLYGQHQEWVMPPPYVHHQEWGPPSSYEHHQRWEMPYERHEDWEPYRSQFQVKDLDSIERVAHLDEVIKGRVGMMQGAPQFSNVKARVGKRGGKVAQFSNVKDRIGKRSIEMVEDYGYENFAPPKKAARSLVHARLGPKVVDTDTTDSWEVYGPKLRSMGRRKIELMCEQYADMNFAKGVLRCDFCVPYGRESPRFANYANYIEHHLTERHSMIEDSYRNKLVFIRRVISREAKLAWYRKYGTQLENYQRKKLCTLCKVPFGKGKGCHLRLRECWMFHEFINPTNCCGDGYFMERTNYLYHLYTIAHNENEYNFREGILKSVAAKKKKILKEVDKLMTPPEETSEGTTTDKKHRKVFLNNHLLAKEVEIFGEFGSVPVPKEVFMLLKAYTGREEITLPKPAKEPFQGIENPIQYYDPSVPIGKYKILFETQFLCTACGEKIGTSKQSIIDHCTTQEHYDATFEKINQLRIKEGLEPFTKKEPTSSQEVEEDIVDEEEATNSQNEEEEDIVDKEEEDIVDKEEATNGQNEEEENMDVDDNLCKKEDDVNVEEASKSQTEEEEKMDMDDKPGKKGNEETDDFSVDFNDHLLYPRRGWMMFLKEDTSYENLKNYWKMTDNAEEKPINVISPTRKTFQKRNRRGKRGAFTP